MTTKAEHHLEHAEHAEHMSHDSFGRKVAMTIAIVAAALALVTMLSHRGHTGTLQLQGESNSLQVEAGILQSQAGSFHTQESDQWNFFQAKNIRQHSLEASADMAKMFESGLRLAAIPNIQPALADIDKTITKWQSDISRWKKDLEDISAAAKALKANALEKEMQADARRAEAAAKLSESHALHLKVDRYDFGEVGIEFSMVLCSVAVLTKRRSFWLAGIVFGIIGAAIVATGLFGIGLESHAAEHAHKTVGAVSMEKAGPAGTEKHAQPDSTEKHGH